MTEEFSLSEKIVDVCDEDWDDVTELFLSQTDVKEFIKRLKEEIKNYVIDNENFNLSAHHGVQMIIDKLAGEKLK